MIINIRYDVKIYKKHLFDWNTTSLNLIELFSENFIDIIRNVINYFNFLYKG